MGAVLSVAVVKRPPLPHGESRRSFGIGWPDAVGDAALPWNTSLGLSRGTMSAGSTLPERSPYLSFRSAGERSSRESFKCSSIVTKRPPIAHMSFTGHARKEAGSVHFGFPISDRGIVRIIFAIVAF